jgi:hypothetical protein
MEDHEREKWRLLEVSPWRHDTRRRIFYVVPSITQTLTYGKYSVFWLRRND